MASKTGTNVLFKKLKQSPEALPLMNGGLKKGEIILLHESVSLIIYQIYDGLILMQEGRAEMSQSIVNILLFSWF